MCICNKNGIPKPLPRSCMKVCTLRESLSSCDSVPRRRSFWGQSTMRSFRGSPSDEHPGSTFSMESSIKDSGHSSQARRRSSALGSFAEALGLHFRRSSQVSSNQDSLGNNTRRTDGKEVEESKDEKTPMVKFCHVSVREYELIPSDNPSVRTGVAIELGWSYNASENIQVDEFETKRSTERSQNVIKDKRLLLHERERLLREFGATRKDIQKAAKRAAIIRNKRKKSVSNIKHDWIHEKLEEKMGCFKARIGRFFLAKVNKNSSSPSLVHMDYDRLHISLMKDVVPV